jgi:hypothetical protein
MGSAIFQTVLAMLFCGVVALFFAGFVLAPLVLLAIGYIVFEIDRRRTG